MSIVSIADMWSENCRHVSCGVKIADTKKNIHSVDGGVVDRAAGLYTMFCPVNSLIKHCSNRKRWNSVTTKTYERHFNKDLIKL